MTLDADAVADGRAVLHDRPLPRARRTSSFRPAIRGARRCTAQLLDGDGDADRRRDDRGLGRGRARAGAGAAPTPTALLLRRSRSRRRGRAEAPHLDVFVFARGLLQHQLTRIYFPDEPEANAADPVLRRRSPKPIARRSSRIGEDDGLRFDIHLQGARETVFFAIEPVRGDLRPGRPGRRGLGRRLARRDARRRACARERGGGGGRRPGGRGHRDRQPPAGASATTSSACPRRPRRRQSGRAARARAALRAWTRSTRACVHLGATSQDIIDTRRDARRAERALLIVDEQLDRSCRRLRAPRGGASRDGRWRRARCCSRRCRRRSATRRRAGSSASSSARTRLGALELPAQLGGAAGTLAALGDDGPEVLRLFAAELGLARARAAVAHAPRPLAELARRARCGRCRRAAKIGRDVVLLAQTEVGEVAEARGGASSTMPHKRNPVGRDRRARARAHVRANAGVLFESGRARARARGRRLARRVGRADDGARGVPAVRRRRFALARRRWSRRRMRG